MDTRKNDNTSLVSLWKKGNSNRDLSLFSFPAANFWALLDLHLNSLAAVLVRRCHCL